MVRKGGVFVRATLSENPPSRARARKAAATRAFREKLLGELRKKAMERGLDPDDHMALSKLAVDLGGYFVNLIGTRWLLMGHAEDGFLNEYIEEAKAKGQWKPIYWRADA